MSRLGHIAKLTRSRAPRWVLTPARAITLGLGTGTTRWRVPGADYQIIGTKRGGTTSLHEWLLQHPDVRPLVPAVRGTKRTGYFDLHRDRPVSHYRAHLPLRATRAREEITRGGPKLVGESAPMYLWDPRVAADIAAVAPHIRSIALLREPAERALSHYRERVANGVEPLSFPEALAAERARTEGELKTMLEDRSYVSTAYDWYSYRARGIYAPQLSNWWRAFPREQLLVLRSEDLFAHPQRTFDEACSFLGLRHVDLPLVLHNASTAAVHRPDIADAMHELRHFYQEPTRELEELLGRSMWPV